MSFPTAALHKLTNRAKTILAETWPYLAFVSLVFIHNYLFLSQGYCPELDEGYLQSLAKRIIDGEQVYLDFYFLRTPLSVYIQTAFMWLFGNSYTLMTARVIWALQMTIAVIIMSDLYRRLVSSWELLLLLSVTHVISTLLLAFPWYSYDGVFFAVVAAVLFQRRNFMFCGVAAVLAGMAKQNYFLLLPLFFMGSMIVKSFNQEVKILSFNSVFRVMVGSSIFMGGYLVYLYFTGALVAFVKNVLLLPPEIGAVSIGYILFQNNAEALYQSLPLIAGVIAIFYLRKNLWSIGAVALGLLIFYGAGLIPNVQTFIFNSLYLSYAVALLAVIEWARKRRLGGSRVRVDLVAALMFVLIIQYLAGFNYGGLFFAYMGAGFALPLTYIMFRDFSPSPYSRVTAILMMLCLLGCGLYLKYKFVYHESARPLLTVEYQHPKLRHIKSTERAVRHLEELLSVIQSRSNEDDYIFVFPHYPALYFLADRKNPTRLVWYYWREFNDEMLAEAVGDLRKNKPALIILHGEEFPELLTDYMSENYLDIELPASIYSDFRVSVLEN